MLIWYSGYCFSIGDLYDSSLNKLENISQTDTYPSEFKIEPYDIDIQNTRPRLTNPSIFLDLDNT